MGEYLSIPPHVLTDFRYDFGNAEQEFSEVINYWLNNSKEHSWKELAEGLKRCGYKQIADYICREYLYEDTSKEVQQGMFMALSWIY